MVSEDTTMASKSATWMVGPKASWISTMFN